ncbi:MAG TPA: hypothetical protein VMZ53_01150 [Kofleriaceae bacterium]|nr:hypothetical protein [Kofleriaceae bacterium]
MNWFFLGGLAGLAGLLASRGLFRRANQSSAARASGLEPLGDLTHIPSSLQKTALWALADGGFERRVVGGILARDGGDVTVTAFDLETLRERRGEWAWLPIEPPFRIAPVVSIVVCEVERAFPHILLKRHGHGDQMADDTVLERVGSVSKLVRDGLGMARSYAAELPAPLPATPASTTLPEGWRAYTQAPDLLETLLPAGLAAALERGGRRDLVVELLDRLVVVYPAARDVVGADQFADLTTTALTIVDGVLAASPPVTPRGIDVTTS